MSVSNHLEQVQHVCLLGCYLLRCLPYLEAGTQFQFNAGLKDYFSVVKPVATAIDILQGDKNCYLGCVLPTIKSLMANVQNTPTSLAAYWMACMSDLIICSVTKTSF